MDLTTSEIIGIRILNPVIFDDFGLFYTKQGIKEINLPIGNYRIEGRFQQIPKIEYKLPDLPIREKIYRVPKLTEITFKYTKDPDEIAKINIYDNLIVINEELNKCSSAKFWAVIFHELGHYRYKTEWKCDVFAIRKMLEYGFNPSQIEEFIDILPDNIPRKLKILHFAKNSDQKR